MAECLPPIPHYTQPTSVQWKIIQCHIIIVLQHQCISNLSRCSFNSNTKEEKEAISTAAVAGTAAAAQSCRQDRNGWRAVPQSSTTLLSFGSRKPFYSAELLLPRRLCVLPHRAVPRHPCASTKNNNLHPYTAAKAPHFTLMLQIDCRMSH